MLSCTTSVRALLHGRQRTLYAVSARLSTAAVSAAQSSAAEKLLFASIKDASAALARGDTSSLALTNACLEQIERTKATNAYTTVLAESARTAAAASDAHRASGAAPRPLEGIPIAVKDNFCVDGAISSAASRVLEGFVAPYDATVVARLRAAGAVIVGKTNMDEFGMGSHTSNTPHGPTFAPLPPPSAPASDAAAPALWDRSAGGSSGGSAAAVAAGTCFAALGSDTGGSVRLPAAYTGTVGLKPTYGLLSRWGLIAYASSLDCPGILTRSCSDAAAVVEAVQGADELDSTCIFSLSSPATSAGAGAGDSQGSLAGVRVGLPRELMLPELSAPVARAWDSAAAALAAEGAEVVTVGLPLLAAVLPVYYTVAPAEAVSNLSRYDGVRYGPSSAPAVPLPAAAAGSASPTAAPAGEAGTAAAVTPLQAMYTATRTAFFGPEVRRRISVGNFVLSSAHYQSFFGRAMALRGEIAAQMVGVLRSTGLSEPAAAAEVSVAAQEQEQAQGQVDLLLLPTATSGAPRLSDLSARAAADPLADLLDDVMTVGPSLAGLPALSVPAGKDAEGLPLGVQLVGPALSERALLRIGQIIADATRDNK